MKQTADGRAATTRNGGSIRYHADGRPVVVNDDREALEEAIAFQVGKDRGLGWDEAREIARDLVRYGSVGGEKIG